MKKTFIILLGFFILFLSSNFVVANSPNLVWLVIDELSLNELLSFETRNIDYLQKIGAFALMNVRTAGHLQAESTYLTIGAGNRSLGNEKNHRAENINGGVINNYIDDLKLLNLNNNYQPKIGYLGQIAQENQIKIAVLGNTDTLKGQNRTIVSMVMDKKGYVPLGDVSESLLYKVDKPWGYQTEWKQMQVKFLEYKKLADALVIETGDFSRIAEYREILREEELMLAKKEAIKGIDDFLAFILQNINLSETQVGIIVPTQTNSLSWLLLAGKNFNSGYLTSISTRREGIVIISDLLSTFLTANQFRGNNINSAGNPVFYLRQETKWQDLLTLNQRINTISNLRPNFIKGFIFLQLIVIILAIFALILNKIGFVIKLGFLEYLLLTIFLIPINYILISYLYQLNLGLIIFILMMITILEIFILQKYFKTGLIRILVVILTLISIIFFSLISNYNLLADSILGYCSIIGARYYGLGNEYMGLFIGSILISVSIILELKGEKWVKYILIPTYISAIYLIGASNLGANFGGTVTAIVAFSTSYFYLKKEYVNKKFFFLMIIMLFSFLVAIIILDYSQLIGTRSHIGRALEPLIRGDWQSLSLIIYRKLSMNLKLLRWTIWTRVLLAFVFCLIIFFQHPVGRLAEIFAKNIYLAAGFYGGLAGGIITMLVNDSGVVAAATLLFYPMLTLLFLVISYNYGNKR